MMKTIDKYLSRLENFLAGGCLIAATALAVFAVLLRNITGDVIFWSEEAVIYLIIFSTFFGAVVTLRHNEHVAVDIMPALLKGKAKKFFVVLGGLATLVYAGFIAYLSWALITEPFSRTTITPALKLPLWVVELSLAVGMTLFFIRAVGDDHPCPAHSCRRTRQECPRRGGRRRRHRCRGHRNRR